MLTLYHGTANSALVPNHLYINSNNDYGSGLYTTPDYDKACEWAMSKYNHNPEVGYVYSYTLDISNLNVLDLTKVRPAIWVAVLLSNRKIKHQQSSIYTRIAKLQKIINFDINAFDIIKGWRADDSYFTYATDFLYGIIDEETLGKALCLGDLGIQFCIKSQKAFKALQHVETFEIKDSKYSRQFAINDRKAREEYANRTSGDGTLITDILRSL